MEQVEVLKRRIHVAEELHSLVRTMKALAAVNIRQLELAVQSLRAYHQTVEAGFQAVLKGQPGFRDLQPHWPGRGMGLLALGSDQGMCGPLNEWLARQCADWYQSAETKRNDDSSAQNRHQAGTAANAGAAEDRTGTPTSTSRGASSPSPGPKRLHRSIFCVGGRLATRLEELGLPVHRARPMVQSRSGLSLLVDDLILSLDDWQREHDLGSIDVVYAEHQSRSSFVVQQMSLLPLDAEWLQQLQTLPWPGHQVPMVWGDRPQRFAELTREFLFCELYRTCAETMASENASRLMAMRQAEQNIEDRRDELIRQYSEARQTAITEELLDIASGFEALEGGL